MNYKIYYYSFTLILFYILLCIFCGFETGIISLDRFKLEQDAKKSKTQKKILDFYDNTDKTLGTTLLGSNISTVIIATISTMLFCEILTFSSTLITIMTTLSILVVCEIIPKSLFRDYPNTLVNTFYPLINFFYIIFTPFVKIVTIINNKLKGVLNIDLHHSFKSFSKEDLAQIFTETFNDGNLLEPQKEMLEDALEFHELTAKDIMVPRLEICAIKDTMTYNEIVKIATDEGYTRYPVYNKSLDKITGVLIIYDLLKNKNKNLVAKDLQREMFFAPESVDVHVLLADMQKNQKSIAVIVDAFGGTAGIVTIEDILEEIVGDIDDEYDVEEVTDIKKIDDCTWIVNAFIKVDDLNKILSLELPEGDYSTIAGLVINRLEKIPYRGQKIITDKYIYEVIEVTNKKIKRIKIQKCKNSPPKL